MLPPLDNRWRPDLTLPRLPVCLNSSVLYKSLEKKPLCDVTTESKPIHNVILEPQRTCPIVLFYILITTELNQNHHERVDITCVQESGKKTQIKTLRETT